MMCVATSINRLDTGSDQQWGLNVFSLVFGRHFDTPCKHQHVFWFNYPASHGAMANTSDTTPDTRHNHI